MQPPHEWTPTYERWRHGGWYVTNVRYVSGACGCVSRNYPDGKWRIVGRDDAAAPTYRNRDEAARAEFVLATDAARALRDLADYRDQHDRVIAARGWDAAIHVRVNWAGAVARYAAYTGEAPPPDLLPPTSAPDPTPVVVTPSGLQRLLPGHEPPPAPVPGGYQGRLF